MGRVLPADLLAKSASFGLQDMPRISGDGANWTSMALDAEATNWTLGALVLPTETGNLRRNPSYDSVVCEEGAGQRPGSQIRAELPKASPRISAYPLLASDRLKGVGQKQKDTKRAKSAGTVFWRPPPEVEALCE